MAIAYKNARAIATTSYATVYTCPAGKTAIVALAQAANVDASARTVNLQWLDSSNSNAATRMAHTLSVPVGSAVNLLADKLFLEAGDVVQVQASANSVIELTLSIIEK